MATVHLTNDNGRSAFSASKNHLGGVTTNGGSHLVVIKQLNTWSNKEFVVTPTEIKYNQAWSLGQEVYAGQQGGNAVLNDTNTLLDNVKNSINTHGWKNGESALFSVFSRAEGPYAVYNYYKHYDPTMPTIQNLSEFGTSVVAYKFNLHRLHLSKMGTSNWTAYVRAWSPSLLLSAPAVLLPCDAILISGGLYNSASQLRVKLFDTLPNISWSVSDSGDSFEFANNCNNGIVVYQDTTLYDQAMSYNPFGGNMAYTTNGNSSRIFSIQQTAQYQNPTNFYHDFQITNSDNVDFLNKNPSEFWLVAHFHCGNGFAQGGANYNGLGQHMCATVFSERLELVIKCSQARFNY